MAKDLYNSLQAIMRLKFLIALGATVTLVLGCASGPEVRESPAKPHRMKKAKPSGWATGEVKADDNNMSMSMSMGVLDERAVDRAIKPHERAMTNCFSRAGEARKYLSGQVVMRFVVTGSGQTSDVQLIKNGLGNYAVESCLVTEGKQIVFPAPEGRQGTDFEYSMNFRSTGERSVIPWSGGELARHLYGIATDLANCGALGNGDVDVIAYIEPGGALGSVGFASQGSLDGSAALCAVALLRQIRVSEAASAHSSVVLRTTFPLAMAFERPVGDFGRKLAKRGKTRP
jgi:hypothetical protein